ncbi:hypothetical protein VTN96DRAFT_116 [Rasamsonia emersonii]
MLELQPVRPKMPKKGKVSTDHRGGTLPNLHIGRSSWERQILSRRAEYCSSESRNPDPPALRHRVQPPASEPQEPALPGRFPHGHPAWPRMRCRPAPRKNPTTKSDCPKPSKARRPLRHGYDPGSAPV